MAIGKRSIRQRRGSNRSWRSHRSALADALAAKQSEFEKRIVDEFSHRWERNPPKRFARWKIEATSENIRVELQQLARKLFKTAITFDAPVVKILYKNVAPENIRDERFLDELKRVMLKSDVPQATIVSLFESGQAAPEAGAFLDR